MAEVFERLSYLEAERIVAILEDTTEKLGFLDSITPDVLQHRDELSKFIGDEISKAMNEQKALERRYEELIEQRSSMKGMVNKNKYKEVQEEIQDVSRALRESTNNLVRSLKENPNVSGNLIKVQRDRTELHDLLLRCNQELRDRGTFHTVTHKVDEERNAMHRLQQLRTREKALRDTVSKLEEQLTNEQRTFHQTVAEQKQSISQLKDELQVLKGSTATDSRFKRKESLANVSAVWREYKLKERLLEVRLKELQDKLQTELIVHGETMDFLARKQTHLGDNNGVWETKYDEEVGELDNEINVVTTARTALHEKLCVLRARKQEELEEQRIAQDNEELAAAMKKKNAAELKRKNRAARTITREIRAYIKRAKEMEAIMGATGKKKGGKAKGKKGKK